MQQIFISIIAFFITLSLIIGVHEFGHFLVARISGIKVLRFSFGFGKKLFSFKDKKGTEYWVSAVPFGGYVKLLDERETKVAKKERHLAFNNQAIYKRMAVIIAGPLFNFFFAVIAFWIMFAVGFTTVKPVIGNVTPHSIAAIAGVKPNQEIITVDSHRTTDWSATMMAIFLRIGDDGSMLVKTNDLQTKKIQPYVFQLNNWKMDGLNPNPITSLGIVPFFPHVPATIGKTTVKTTLKVGDNILAVANKPVKNWNGLVKQIRLHPDQELIFKIRRDNKIIVLPIKIGYKLTGLFKKVGFLGIAPEFKWPEKFLNDNTYSILPALVQGCHRTVDFVYINIMLMGKMITGDFSVQSLGGPIAIFKGAGQSFYLGFTAFLGFLGFLSITIGILNLLPIPGLDGSHFCYLIFEAVTGKEVSVKVQTWAFRIGMMLLIILMVQALLNDILRLLT